MGFMSAPEYAVVSRGTLEEQVWAQLRTCFDPEIPVNIVDLGLVYNCEIADLPEGGQKVEIKMTLTAPGCGMGPVLASDVKQKVEGLPGVKEADVEVVFDPQWNPNMMTEAARLQRGFFEESGAGPAGTRSPPPDPSPRSG